MADDHTQNAQTRGNEGLPLSDLRSEVERVVSEIIGTSLIAHGPESEFAEVSRQVFAALACASISFLERRSECRGSFADLAVEARTRFAAACVEVLSPTGAAL